MGKGWDWILLQGVCICGHILHGANSCPSLSHGYPWGMEVSIPPSKSKEEGEAEDLVFPL